MRIEVLFPERCNLYGDLSNVEYLKRCLPQADGTLRLQRFCIRRDCRGQGAGRQTLREVEERFRREGFSAVALDAKCSAQGFYTACGYETVSAPFLEAGVLHVAMQRPL